MSKLYRIEENELRYLIGTSIELEALVSGGVDNWSWYSDSINDYCNDYAEINHVDVECINDIVDVEIKDYVEV